MSESCWSENLESFRLSVWAAAMSYLFRRPNVFSFQHQHAYMHLHFKPWNVYIWLSRKGWPDPSGGIFPGSQPLTDLLRPAKKNGVHVLDRDKLIRWNLLDWTSSLVFFAFQRDQFLSKGPFHVFWFFLWRWFRCIRSDVPFASKLWRKLIGFRL